MPALVHRVRELVRKEVRQLFRDPRMRPLIFASPIIQLVVFGYAVNTDIRNTATVVMDHDHSAESRELISSFSASGYFEIVSYAARPADVVDALDGGRAVIGLEIPAGFARDLAVGREANIQVLVDGSDSNTGTVAQGYAARIVQAFSLARAGGDRTPGVDLRARAWYNPQLESRVYNVPAIIGVLLMLMCLLLTALSVVREREIGTLDQLMVSPITPTELILGKTIPVIVIAFIDLLLITAVAVLWFDIPFRGSPFVLLPAAFLFILAGLGFGLLISTISKTQQEAFMSMFLFFLPAIILSGFFFPISSMPEMFQWITLLNPLRFFLEAVRAIFLKGAGFAELWSQYLAIAAMAGGALWLATVRFNKSYA